MATYTFVITDNGDDGGFLVAAGTSEVTAPLTSLVMKEGHTYRLDFTGATKVMALSTTEDGALDGGEADLDAMAFYVDGTLLEDIAEGDSAAVQWATAQAAGEGNPGGWTTSLYIDIDPTAFSATQMFFYDAAEAGVGGTFTRMWQGINAANLSSGPSYRATAGGEHHKAPPAMRLAKKGVIRSAAVQTGSALDALDENTSTGTKRGSNNSGHPPLAGGETVGGGSKGHSN